MKAQRPGSSSAQQAAVQQRLLQAEEEVHAAAAAAQHATQQLQLMAAEKEQVQQELQAIRQQLETLPVAQQQADLHNKLMVRCTACCVSSAATGRLMRYGTLLLRRLVPWCCKLFLLLMLSSCCP